MKYAFPKGLYADVRVEHVFSTRILYTLKELDDCREKRYSAAFIRVFDGTRWYYASTTDLDRVQAELDALARLATPNEALFRSPVYEKFSDRVDEVMVYEYDRVSDVPLADKIALLHTLMPHLEQSKCCKLWRAQYLDEYVVKEFTSSKGADLRFDYQRCGYSCSFQMADGERRLREAYQKGNTSFAELRGHEEALTEKLRLCEDFLLRSEAVEPGVYTVILAPMVTGVFAHECFGHKSESDFMVGDEAAKNEWALGKRLGFEELTIADTGTLPGAGYVPYDDEGNPAGTSSLIKNGILTGRLHNAASAADLGEAVTGNGRAVSYEFEPIVRMTTTYIDKGTKTKEQLIAETERGILVKDIMHGSGMSTFTLAPTLAYMIEDGKIGKPVRVSVVSGNVFTALGDIDGLSDTVEFNAFVTGGCGKMEQYPLPVGMGGPYMRVRNMNVQ